MISIKRMESYREHTYLALMQELGRDGDGTSIPTSALQILR
jgi:hypothetical protein